MELRHCKVGKTYNNYATPNLSTAHHRRFKIVAVSEENDFIVVDTNGQKSLISYTPKTGATGGTLHHHDWTEEIPKVTLYCIIFAYRNDENARWVYKAETLLSPELRTEYFLSFGAGYKKSINLWEYVTDDLNYIPETPEDEDDDEVHSI